MSCPSPIAWGFHSTNTLQPASLPLGTLCSRLSLLCTETPRGRNKTHCCDKPASHSSEQGDLPELLTPLPWP